MKLLDYIRGNRTGREAHRLEREAMEDPFLRDALEGFDAVQGDHEEALRRLQARLARRTAPPLRRRNWPRASVAALLLAGSVGGLFLLLQRHDRTPGPLATLPSAPPKDTSVLSEALTPPPRPAAPEAKPGAPEEGAQRQAVAGGALESAKHASDLDMRELAEESAHEEIMEEEAALAIVQELRADASMRTREEAAPSPQEERALPGVSPSKDRSESHVSDISLENATAKQESDKRRVVTGKVIAADDGEPIIGATVQAIGGASGTITDLDGKYTLEVKEGDKIRLSYLGYESKEYRVDGPVLDAALLPDGQTLSDVVVIGRGSSPREQQTKTLGSGTVELRQMELRQRLEEALVPLMKSATQSPGGRMVVEFNLGEWGYPTNIRITNGLNPKADREIKQLVRQEEAWPVADTTIRLEIPL